MCNISENKFVKYFKLKFQTVAAETAKNFRGLLYFAAPCRLAIVDLTDERLFANSMDIA